MMFAKLIDVEFFMQTFGIELHKTTSIFYKNI